MGNHAHTATHGVQLRMKGLMQPLVGPSCTQMRNRQRSSPAAHERVTATNRGAEATSTTSKQQKAWAGMGTASMRAPRSTHLHAQPATASFPLQRPEASG